MTHDDAVTKARHLFGEGCVVTAAPRIPRAPTDIEWYITLGPWMEHAALAHAFSVSGAVACQHDGCDLCQAAEAALL